MENFLRRLKYYGIGFGIGLIFVIFFFKNKGCAWTPENRVKTAIFERLLVINDENKKELEKLDLSEKELIQILRNSDIDFQKSKKTDQFKVYHFDCKAKSSKEFIVLLTLGKESFLSEVLLKEKKTSRATNSIKGIGEIIYFPKERNFLYVDTTDKLNCQKEVILVKDNDQLFQRIRKNGYIDFEKSNLKRRPKPEHCLVFRDKKNREIRAFALWHMDKIEIFKMDLSFDSSCK
ncbi:MAG: hypothetical protein FJZ67_00235 [Bacteroidetes bacterium]|nr:hypothetical protein [Bacteroidota bacterium]